jgi:hypothetical protein
MGLGKLFGSKIVDAFKIIKETEGKSDYDRQQKFLQAGWTTNQMIAKPTSLTKSTPTTVDVTAPKKKYSSIGSSQMRSGRSSTIQTSPTGLMSKASIDKKTLLGG